MKNADMPAMPLSGDAYGDFAAYDGTSKTSYNPECQGLTKREEMAIRFAAAMIVNAGRNGYRDCTDPAIFSDAVIAADTQLKALEDS